MSEDFGQQADSFANLPLVQTRVAEDDGRLGCQVGPCQVAVRHAVDADSTRGCAGDDGLFRDALFGPQRDVRAAAVAGYFNTIAEMLLNGFEQGFAAAGVSA